MRTTVAADDYYYGGTEEQLMTAWFDLRLTNQRKGAFRSCPRVFPVGALEQSAINYNKNMKKLHEIRLYIYTHMRAVTFVKNKQILHFYGGIQSNAKLFCDSKINQACNLEYLIYMSKLRKSN